MLVKLLRRETDSGNSIPDSIHHFLSSPAREILRTSLAAHEQKVVKRERNENEGK
jgi:hypothetical protein